MAFDRSSSAALLALLAASLVVPPTAAHAAPDPPEPMTRLLHDYNDDWGGDAGARGGHDLIALDLAERYNATLKTNVVVFRLSMGGGFAGQDPPARLRDVLTFKAGGEDVELELATTDNKRFTGTLEGITGPVPLRKADRSVDGTRFYVEGFFSWDEVGLDAGDRISSFSVQGYADDAKADHMVGGFTVDGQKNDAVPPSEEASPASYRRSQYELRGPVMYVTTQLEPSEVEVNVGDNKTVSWTLTNPLGRPQTVSLAANAPPGVAVSFHDGEHYGDGALTTRLDADGTKLVHAYVLSTARPEPGTLHLALVTNLGGYLVEDVEINGGAAEEGGGRGLPTPSVALVLLGLVLAALARRH